MSILEIHEFHECVQVVLCTLKSPEVYEKMNVCINQGIWDTFG